MSEERIDTQDLPTGAMRAMRHVDNATHRDTLPKWLFAWIGVNSIGLYTLMLTDVDEREAVFSQLPNALHWAAENGPLFISVATAIGTAFAVFRKKASE